MNVFTVTHPKRHNIVLYELYYSYTATRLNTISNLKFKQEDSSENETVINRHNCKLDAFLPSNNTEISNQNINVLTMLPIDSIQRLST